MQQPSPLTDKLLWQQFKDGDKRAFAQLFDQYSNSLLKYGLTLWADPDFIKDCIQDLFIELWKHRQNLAEVVSVRLYMLTSFRRVIFRRRNAAKKRVKLKNSYEGLGGEVLTDSPEHLAIDVESTFFKQRILFQEIDKLPDRQREAVFLRFYEDMSYEEITEVMGLNYQVVRNTIYRAVKTLRLRLDKFKYLVFFALSLLAAFLLTGGF